MNTFDVIAETSLWATRYGAAAWDRWSASRPPMWRLIVSNSAALGTLAITVRPRTLHPVTVETPGRRRALTELHVATLTPAGWRGLLDAAATTLNLTPETR